MGLVTAGVIPYLDEVVHKAHEAILLWTLLGHCVGWSLSYP